MSAPDDAQGPPTDAAEDDEEEIRLLPPDPPPAPVPTRAARAAATAEQRLEAGPPAPTHPEFEPFDTTLLTLRVWGTNLVAFVAITALAMIPTIVFRVVFRLAGAETLSRLALWLDPLLSTIASAAIVVGVALHLDGQQVTIRLCLRRAAESWLTVLGTSLLVWLCTYVAALLGGVTILAATTLFGWMALGLFGFLIALLLWIYVSVCVAVPAAVIERDDPITAMRRSAYLVDGIRWRVGGVLGLFLLIGLSSIGFAEAIERAAPAIAPFLSGAVSIVVLSLDAALAGVIYHDLRRIADGLDSAEIARQLVPVNEADTATNRTD